MGGGDDDGQQPARVVDEKLWSSLAYTRRQLSKCQDGAMAASLVDLAMQAIGCESRTRGPAGTSWRKEVVGAQLDAQHLLSKLCGAAMPTLEKAVASSTAYLTEQEAEVLRGLNVKAGAAKHKGMGKDEVAARARRQKPRVAVERLATAAQIAAQAAATALGARQSHAETIANVAHQAVLAAGAPGAAQPHKHPDREMSKAASDPGTSQSETTGLGSYSSIDGVSCASDDSCGDGMREVFGLESSLLTPVATGCEEIEPDRLDLWFADGCQECAPDATAPLAVLAQPAASCANNDGAAPTCADIDECATNNGCCGDAKYYSCTNNDGAAPACGGCGDAKFYTCKNNDGAAPTCADSLPRRMDMDVRLAGEDEKAADEQFTEELAAEPVPPLKGDCENIHGVAGGCAPAPLGRHQRRRLRQRCEQRLQQLHGSSILEARWLAREVPVEELATLEEYLGLERLVGRPSRRRRRLAWVLWLGGPPNEQ